MIIRRIGILIASTVLGSCAALNNIHDPHSGLINREQVPKLLQSIRCELVTYYDANRRRQRRYENEKKKNDDTVRKYAFFPLDDSQLGAVFLDLKVTDTLAIPSGSSATTFNAKFPKSATDSTLWHVGPNFSDTNTYELNWPFAIQQSATLDLHDDVANHGRDGTAKSYFPCFKKPTGPFYVEGLARHTFPEYENFDRMYVNGTEPLAGWLLDSGAEVGTAFFPGSATAGQTEKIYPAQMIYTFTVQIGIGADVLFSLTSLRWNPAALDLSGSSQQTSTLTVYVNGYDSKNANGAKVGIVQNAATPGNLFEFKFDNGTGKILPKQILPKRCAASPELCSGGTLSYPLAIPLPQ